MTETADDTVVIEQTVHIGASPETVWRLWTEPAGLAEWWGTEAEVVLEPGGIFRVVIGEGPVMRGAFTELDRPRRLAFTFGWEQNLPSGPLAPGSTLVEVTLTPDRDGTVLVLRHSEMPATHAPDHEQGWRMFLDRLATAAAAAGAA